MPDLVNPATGRVHTLTEGQARVRLRRGWTPPAPDPVVEFEQHPDPHDEQE